VIASTSRPARCTPGMGYAPPASAEMTDPAVTTRGSGRQLGATPEVDGLGDVANARDADDHLFASSSTLGPIAVEKH